jgi:hypothetical protein
MTGPESHRPVLLAARLAGWALTLLLVGGLLLAARWMGAWFAGREVETKLNTQLHEAKVSDCVWVTSRGLSWQQCEDKVSRAEVEGGPGG